VTLTPAPVSDEDVDGPKVGGGGLGRTVARVGEVLALGGVPLGGANTLPAA